VSILYLYLALLVLLTFLSATFSSSETAFFSQPQSRINLWKNSTDERKQAVARLLSHSRHLLVLIFILNIVTNVLLQNTASALSELIHGGLLFTIAVPLLLILICGEFFPKYLGLVFNESFAMRAAPLFLFLEKLLLPLQKIITTLAEGLSRILFFFLKPEPALSKKDLETILTNCEEKQVLTEDEGAFIRFLVDFDSKLARQIMTPRSSVNYLQLSDFSLEKAKELFQTTHKGALLIVNETPDKPVGAITGLVALDLAEHGTLDHIKNQIFYLPETTSSHRLLQEFSVKQALIACIIDEHGTVSGYVYRDDISKYLLGLHSKQTFLARGSDTFTEKTHVFPGTTQLSTINERYDKQLLSEHHSGTLSGWLCEHLDTIPQAGTCFEYDGLEFRIILADPKTVQQVFIQKSRHPTRSTP
jgi:putative hemolysin